MTKHRKTAWGLLLSLCWLLASSGGAQAIVLGGRGAPQSEHCKSVGGTEVGQFCVLENGSSCESMTLFRDAVCKDENGNIIDEGPDFGSNLPPGEGDSEGGDE